MTAKTHSRQIAQGNKRVSARLATVPVVSAASRVLAVLEALTRERAIKLEDLAREVKLAKPTVYRFLVTLQQLGYVRRDEAERWAITLKMFNVGARALDHLDLHAAARPVAERLAEELGETVHLGVLDGDTAVCVMKIETRNRIRMYSRVGRRMPLYCTAMGKVLLAFMPDEERDATLGMIRLTPMTANTIVSRVALDEHLAQVRARGHAIDREEHEDGVCCLAAPIFDHADDIVGALSVAVPSFRRNPDAEAGNVAKLKAAARSISEMLGHTGKE